MNNLPKVIEPLELIAPLPLQWEIAPVLENSPIECSTGTIVNCNTGKG